MSQRGWAVGGVGYRYGQDDVGLAADRLRRGAAGDFCGAVEGAAMKANRDGNKMSHITETL